MSETVIIKSNKYGIHLILDPEVPFGELLHAVSRKFEEAAKFFGKAAVAISFEGRDLSQGESFRIIESITAHTDVRILCIVDEEPTHATLLKQQIAAYYDALAGKEALFFRGTLRSGQSLEKEAPIVFVGDVCAGAQIASEGSILVMGGLFGSAHAGCKGDETAFVSALEMAPEQLKIGGCSAFLTGEKTKQKKLRLKEKAPQEATVQMARVRGREVETITLLPGMLTE